MKVIITSEKPITSADITSAMSYIKKEYEGGPINHMEIQFGDDASVLNLKITAKGSFVYNNKAALSSESHHSPQELHDAAIGNLKPLFDFYERLSGRPLRHAEQQVLVTIVEEIGLPVEVSMLLVDCCFKIGKPTPAYIKAVASDWIENDITDVFKATKRTHQMIAVNDITNTIRNEFEIKSSFSQKERQMISEWKKMGFGDDLILEASKICVKNCDKLSFPYIDKVLRKWVVDNGITTVEQLYNKQNHKTVFPANAGNISYTQDPVDKIISEDDALKAVISKYESIQNRAATTSEQEAIVSIVRNIGLPADVAVIMMDYCKIGGAFTIELIIRTARCWIEGEVDTTPKAEYLLRRVKQIRLFEDEFRKTTGYTAEFTSKQMKMITTWICTWEIEEALIYEAYAITHERTGMMAFPYMNAILKTWVDNGIKTIKELDKVQKENKEQNRKAGT